MSDKSLYKLGERYTYYTKELCYKQSLNAVRQGYQVRYGKTRLGTYFYEIVDPFEEEEGAVYDR
jgi:hypothetical protein